MAAMAPAFRRCCFAVKPQSNVVKGLGRRAARSAGCRSGGVLIWTVESNQPTPEMTPEMWSLSKRDGAEPSRAVDASWTADAAVASCRLSDLLPTIGRVAER